MKKAAVILFSLCAMSANAKSLQLDEQIINTAQSKAAYTASTLGNESNTVIQLMMLDELIMINKNLKDISFIAKHQQNAQEMTERKVVDIKNLLKVIIHNQKG